MDQMTALVIGASGGFGGAVARELLRRGHRTRIGSHSGRARDLPGEHVQVDALDEASLRRAAEGADVIVYGFSVPYPQWKTAGLAAARATASVAAELKACVLFPGNVYGLGPDFSKPLTEDAGTEPRSRKGAIRNEIEAAFAAASTAGARVIVLRAGDFFGPHCTQSWFLQMTGRIARGGPIVRLGPAHVPHAWAYLPDMARAGVDLLERRKRLSSFERFHFAGYALDNDAMIAALRRVLREPERRVTSWPWWLLRLAAPFVPMAREASELHYLWTEPVLLDDAKLRRTLPAFQLTPLDDALAASLAAR